MKVFLIRALIVRSLVVSVRVLLLIMHPGLCGFLGVDAPLKLLLLIMPRSPGLCEVIGVELSLKL
jgi:hypothetical protein